MLTASPICGPASNIEIKSLNMLNRMRDQKKIKNENLWILGKLQNAKSNYSFDLSRNNINRKNSYKTYVFLIIKNEKREVLAFYQ